MATTTTTTTTGTTSTTTSTTTSPTTTTTTSTKIPPHNVLKKVQTIIFKNGIEVGSNNASDSPNTTNTPFTQSLTFGTIAPQEISETTIVALRVPNARGIRNVRLALIDTGGLEFTINRFGVYSTYQLDENIVPTTYFQGINKKRLASHKNNIIIGSRNNTTSDYVYLNVKMPSDNVMMSGTIRYKWFFDYSD